MLTRLYYERSVGQSLNWSVGLLVGKSVSGSGSGGSATFLVEAEAITNRKSEIGSTEYFGASASIFVSLLLLSLSLSLSLLLLSLFFFFLSIFISRKQ